jgi:uncharacterized repeat protein (TIGR01451 family)
VGEKQAVVLTVTGNTASVPYDGEEHSVKGYTTAITVDGAAANALPGNLQLDEEKAKVKAATGKDAGTYSIGLVEGDFSITGSDLEKYSVTVQVTDGSLTILPRTVTLTSADATMAYDGTALTAPEVTIGSLGFVDGEVTSVTANGTQTAVGKSDNKPIEIVEGTNYKDSNYEIKEAYGTLEVTASTAAFTITAKDAEKTYDGTALTESGYTVTKPQGFENFKVTAVVSGTITDAGTEENTVDSYTIKDPSGTDVTGNFKNVAKVNGTLTVKRREVTLHSESKSKEYDGTALTASAVTTSDPAFVDGEVTDIKATGTITDVGFVTNTISYTGTDKFKAANYDITLDEGKLTVDKNSKKITITAESDSKTYDGTALTNSTYKVEDLPTGFTVSDVTVTGSATNVKDTKAGNNVVTGGKILNAEGKDVTEYFADITRIDGTLEILPRQVTLTSATDAKPYDGTPLTNSKVDITGDGFVDGEVSDVRATGSITDVGTVDNPISYTTNDAFQADNYQITEVMGKLTVAAANVDLVITAPSETFKYDGTAHSTGNSGVTVSWSPEESGSNYTVEAVVEGSVTNVSRDGVENKITSYKILNANGDDITKNFDSSRIKTVSGTIRVTPRPVTLTSQSVTREYNGTALTAPDVTVGGDGFVDGEVSDIKATGTIIKAGSVTNEIVYTTGTNFAALNYEIEMKEGTLTVTQNQSKITITAGSSSKKYDGTALADGSYTVDGLPEGFTVSGVTVIGSATNVSDTKSGNNQVTGGKIQYNNEDVTDQFANIKRIDGTLTILPRHVTLTSATDSKKYDGDPLTNSTVTEGGDKFVQGEVTDLKATGSQTEKGTSNNPISYNTVTGKFRAENYEIEEVIGTLTVYAADTELVLTAPSGTWEYDGTAHSTENNVTATWPSVDDAAKYTVFATVSGSVKDVEDGTVDNVIDTSSIKITDSTGKDVTGNFDTSKIKTVNGTLSVYARKVTLTSKSADKAYDGTALTAPEVTVSGSGFVDGEVDADSIKATGSITKVGSAANTITYKTAGAFKKSNYNITKQEGTLTITQNTTLITVKSADDSKTYDGTPLTNDKITTTGLPEGFTLTAEVTGSITDVDPKSPSGNNTVANAVITTKEDGKDVDVTDQFSNITYQAGTLSILPRKVTLESKSESKPYDGTALTAPEVTVGGDGFVDGEVTDIKATGTITEKGSVKNTITYTKQTAFKESNYIVTETTGTLTIVPANVALVITAPSRTWEYDGTAHSTGNSDVTVTWTPEANGSKYSVQAVVEGSVTNVIQGKVDNKIVSYTIRNADGKDVTGQFDSKLIQTVNGTLQVTPRYVELTSASAEKPYDGTALTAPDVTVGGSGFVTGEVSNLKATGSALTTDDGEVKNTIEWTAGKNYDSRNYTIVKHEGILKITQNQADITVTAGSATRVYDGTALTNSAATVTGLPTEFTATVTVDGSATKVADTTTGNNKVAAVKITRDGKDVTNQFAKITKKDGTLTITKRPVTLKSESGSKPYDGTALELPKVTVTGDGFVDGEIAEGSIKATGSIKTVGSVLNSITYKPTLLGNFNENNYEITKEVGILSISKAVIAFHVTANSHTWTYDGKTHTDSGYTVTIPDNDKETYGKFTVEAVVEGSVTNVTKKPVANKITNVTVKEQDGLLWKDVTGQFDIDDMILVDGELQISPAELTLTSDSGTKEYDGTPLELPKVKVEGSIITTNGKAQISNIRATGSVTGVTTDPVPNTISYETSEDFIRDNYVIIMKEGTLTVTKNTKTKIVFTADSAEKTYDGTPLTASNVTVEGLEKLPKGFTAQAEAGGSITNVAQTAEGNNPVVKAIILDKDGKDVTDWFTDVTKKAGKLTITPREITLTSADAEKPYDGTPLEKKEVTVTGAHGLADTHTIEYTFTGSQTYVGSSLNTFTYLIKDKEGNVIPASEVTAASKKSSRVADSTQKGNYLITVVYGTLTVTDKVEPGVVVTKNHKEKAYQLSEQIVFEIKVTNIYDTAQTITLTEQDGVVFTGPDTFTDVKPGGTVTTWAYHVVNEEDLAKGSYTNTVKAAFKEAGKTWEGTDEEDQFAHLTLAKEVTNTPANGTAYVNGETINYRITVTNDGTAELYSLNIADVMTGDEWNNIQSLAPGEKLTFEASWKVTDKDVENGYVRNQAVGNAKDANDNYVRPQPASVQVPVQKAKPSLYVEKTSDKDKAVELGETIHYTIRVVNNGNTPVSDIVVTDEMTGDSWDAGTLKPGEDKTFRTEYVVTEKDILAGSVKNVALADGKDPNGDKPDVTPGEKEDKTVPENSHLTLTKTTTSSPKNRSGYAAGETIRYRIEAVNDGNLTLTDVEVKDPLTGETWKVEKLAPGEKQTFETKYTVTEKDQNAGKVVNEATAKGKTPGSSELIVVPGKTSDPVLPKAAASVTVSNTVQTGDPTQTGAYLAMLFVAAGGILVLARKKKKERRK